MRLRGFFKIVATHPIESIGFVLAVCLAVIGVYILSPYYELSPIGSLAALFDNYWARVVIGFGYLFAAAPFFASFNRRVNTDRFQKLSTFWMFISFLFITFLRFTATGVRPVTWVYSLTLALIAAIIHLWIDRRTYGGD